MFRQGQRQTKAPLASRGALVGVLRVAFQLLELLWVEIKELPLDAVGIGEVEHRAHALSGPNFRVLDLLKVEPTRPSLKILG